MFSIADIQESNDQENFEEEDNEDKDDEGSEEESIHTYPIRVSFSITKVRL
jgi:complement component 1 Q subcomponent-binding protein